MNHDRALAVKVACATQALAVHSLGEYTNPNDCFCGDNRSDPDHFRSTYAGLRFVLEATIEKLRREGITVREDLVAEIERMLNS